MLALEPLDARADVAKDVAVPAVAAGVLDQADLGLLFRERFLRFLGLREPGQPGRQLVSPRQVLSFGVP